MSISSDEAKEKQLVEKAELRLAIADSPQKFETNLQTFLPPLLLKLASPHASVRTAVFSALKNLISRINTLPQVQLPVRAAYCPSKGTQFSRSTRLDQCPSLQSATGV